MPLDEKTGDTDMQNITRMPLRHLTSFRFRTLGLAAALLLPLAASAEEPQSREPAEVYRQICAHCHAPDKAVGPEITMAFPEEARETWGNYIRMTVRNGRAAMPSFRPAKISDTELEQLIEALASGELAPAAGEE